MASEVCVASNPALSPGLLCRSDAAPAPMAAARPTLTMSSAPIVQ